MENLFYEPFSCIYFMSHVVTIEKVIRKLTEEARKSSKSYFLLKDFLKEVCGADYPNDVYIPLSSIDDMDYSISIVHEGKYNGEPSICIDWGELAYEVNYPKDFLKGE